MTDLKSAAWQSFVLVTQNFLGNHKAEYYQKLMENFKQSKDLGIKMSVKVHYHFSHLDCFPVNLGDLSEEHGERFHRFQRRKVIKGHERGVSGRWNSCTMADYCSSF